MKKFYILLLALISLNGAWAQGCLPEGIKFTTQAQVDNFQTIYPGCTEIVGDVTIYGDNITNLNGLSIITSIGGNLIIGDEYGLGNLALTGLTGLEGVTSIGGDLGISGNTALTSLTGLEGVTSVGGDLWIYDHPALTSLTGLENIDSIGEDLGIKMNSTMDGLAGLESLTSVGIDLEIYGNPIVNLEGLNNLLAIGGNLFIAGYTSSELTSLSGLESLTSIGGHLVLSYNDNLSDISALSNLSTIGGNLTISSNLLHNLSGLDNIAPGSIQDIRIINNNSLSDCDVQSICSYLAAPNGTVEIHDNAPGCNSPKEVEAACQVGVENAPQYMITVHPNPSTDLVTITLPEIVPQTTLSILNLNGQEIMRQALTAPTTQINISHLPTGLYFMKVTSNKTVQVVKLIKE